MLGEGLENMMNEFTYNGPGSTLANRINEYGIMIIGVVGNARYGWDDAIDGLFGVSIWLCDSSAPLTGFTTGAVAAAGITLWITRSW